MRYVFVLIAAFVAMVWFPPDKAVMLLLAIGASVCCLGAGIELVAVPGQRHLGPQHRRAVQAPPVPRSPPDAGPHVAWPDAEVRGSSRGKSSGEPILPGDFPLPPLFAGLPATPAHSSPWHLPRRPVQPAVAADEATLGGISAVAASVIGTGHRCAEPAEPRQDAYRIARDEDGRHLIIAVADGISSCRFSDLGATVAVTTAVNTVRQMLGDNPDLARLDAAQIFTAVAQRMLATAKERQLRSSDLGTVLIVAVIPSQADRADGSRPVWASWLGDVSAWTLLRDRWDAFAGDRKEVAGGLESSEIEDALPWAPQAVQSSSWQLSAGGTVAFVTDGLGDAFHLNEAVNRHFAESWSKKPRVTSFLNDMTFDAPSCQDDRTAVIIWTDK